MPHLNSKARTKQKVSEAELLEAATLRLMKAIKKKAAEQKKPLSKKELLKQGYSERFVDKLSKA